MEGIIMSGMVEILVLAAPFAALAGLLSLTGRAQARRARYIGRQIALTDAIHRELGAVAAPEVTLGPRGGWVVRMAVPLHHASLVASLARITRDLFARLDRPGSAPLEIVLAHRDAPRPIATPSGIPSVGPRRLHAA
jgi:hypothetical protein